MARSGRLTGRDHIPRPGAGRGRASGGESSYRPSAGRAARNDRGLPRARGPSLGSSARGNGGENRVGAGAIYLRCGPMAAAEVDPIEFRDVCARFATGVCVITSFGPEGPSGLTANAVSSLSLRPPLMIVCFDRGARTLGAVEHSRRFGVHFLAHDQEGLAGRFASKDAEEVKFADVRWSERSGVPAIDGCLGLIACQLRDLIPGGDHLIGVGEVIDVAAGNGDPLVFFRSDYWSLTGREPAPPAVDEALEGPST
jgi:flavin reductase (DIM6/NTAB) family NADH-FMN oxidoreductase RutF